MNSFSPSPLFVSAKLKLFPVSPRNFIEELSVKIHIISINSAIESARLGEKGKSFAIISREIAKISEEMKSYTKLIENQIKNIREYTIRTNTTETTTTKKMIMGQPLFIFNNLK